MIIECPKCGEKASVKGLGRKPLNISLKNICEALRLYRSVEVSAQNLGCSQGYIYNALKSDGIKLKDIVN